jgi:hypothetical protein
MYTFLRDWCMIFKDFLNDLRNCQIDSVRVKMQRMKFEEGCHSSFEVLVRVDVLQVGKLNAEPKFLKRLLFLVVLTDKNRNNSYPPNTLKLQAFLDLS